MCACRQFLDICEARDLFHVLCYEELGPERFAHAMVDVRIFVDHKGQLNLDSVVDALVYVTSKHGLGVPESKVPKKLEQPAEAAPMGWPQIGHMSLGLRNRVKPVGPTRMEAEGGA